MGPEIEKYRAKLVEKISETDDVLMEKYLGNEEISVEELKAALRRAVIAYKLVPIFAGSSLRNKEFSRFWTESLIIFRLPLIWTS